MGSGFAIDAVSGHRACPIDPKPQTHLRAKKDCGGRGKNIHILNSGLFLLDLRSNRAPKTPTSKPLMPKPCIS